MKKYLSIIAALAVSVSSFAQGFNPVVEVTNTFEGKLMEVNKQNLEMSVPDSLLRFDWDFDYSTFENPYKGAYDFTPYAMNIAPEKEGYTGRNLYLRAGAGYSFHPELNAVWSPNLNGRFQMSVYDDLKGYSGSYHCFKYNYQGSRYDLSEGDPVAGSDYSNRMGVNAMVDGRNLIMVFDAGWDAIRAMYDRVGNDYNSLDASIGLRSAGRSRTSFELDAKILRGWEKAYGHVLPETLLKLGGVLGRKTDIPGLAAGVSFGSESAWWTEDFGSGKAGFVYAEPQLSRTWERASAKLGLKLALPYNTAHKGTIVYPQFYADYMLSPESLKLFASLTGGPRLDSFHSTIRSYHFVPSDFAFLYSDYLGDVTIDAYDARIGMTGRVNTRLQYTLSAGVERHANMLAASFAGYHYGPSLVEYHTDGRVRLDFGRTDVLVKHADLEAAWTSDRFDLDATVTLRDTQVKDSFRMILPSALSGSLNARYNWNRRIYAGVSLQAASGRTGQLSDDYLGSCMTLPGWVDLGLSGEYELSRRLTVWAKGCNLLGHRVQRNLLYVEKGPYFTAGICLSL